MIRSIETQHCVVAIPARDERDRIVPCLEAIAASVRRDVPSVLLLTNNTTDGTGEVAGCAARLLGLTLHVVDIDLPPDRISAGEARRLAMAHAASFVGADGVLITTDADGRVEPDWLDANLRAIEDGADAVCGMAVIDSDEAQAIPQILHDDDAREVFYATLLDELSALIDPDLFDPWPRHAEESGASIAVRKRVFARAGGIPALRSGEDRAFVDALRRVDARIRHAPDARVIVSGRLDGRAAGGMAETIRRRMIAQDEMLDDRLEPVADAVFRVECRARLRRAGVREFGRAWEACQMADLRLLTRRRVRRSDIEEEIATAKALRDDLRSMPATERPLRPTAPTEHSESARRHARPVHADLTAALHDPVPSGVLGVVETGVGPADKR